jgi:hypothetical protein
MFSQEFTERDGIFTRNTEDRDRYSLPSGIDSIYCGPMMITIGEIETILKNTGACVETVTEKERN